MEVLAIITEFDNKENISPFSVQKLTPNSSKLKFCKRKFRRPLKDITNSVAFARFQRSDSFSSQEIVRRKRKEIDENVDSLQKQHCSKMLRTYFR
ncbi:hypothetical protein MTR67_032694 [Solanum verrucosum]|uniref:Uncharacterized protein n=1 Tax=Solanum verrucosum TaxID=315347 RepID=A0AAF0U4W5_SOLVR|nr:hypothetical protein MTR67_032694 [Solanum verrucosum]